MNNTQNYALYCMAALASSLIALALLVYGIIAQDWIVAGFAAVIVACSLTSYPLIRQKRNAEEHDSQ